VISGDLIELTWTEIFEVDVRDSLILIHTKMGTEGKAKGNNDGGGGAGGKKEASKVNVLGLAARKLKKTTEAEAKAAAGAGAPGDAEGMALALDEELDHETTKILSEVEDAQTELEAMNEKASDEILDVERKYNQLRKPILAKRNESISKIGNFWIRTMQNHPQLAMLIDDEEDDCLQYLSKIHVEEAEDVKSGFKIEFHFAQNPYFENEVLVKEYPMGDSDGGGDSESDTLKLTQSTEILWKPGMDLVNRMGKVTINPRKRRHQVRTFFSWFSEKSDPHFDDIGELIRADLWTNPLAYFMSEDEDEADESSDLDEESEGEDDGSDPDERGMEDCN
jgi:template-activating factor I